MSNYLWSHELQHARLLCTSSSPRVTQTQSTESMMPSNHLILCHSLLLLPSVFPSIRIFSMSWLFISCGQSIGTSASVLPMNIQNWVPLGLTGLNFLQSKGLSRVLFSITVRKHKFFGAQPSLWSNSHIRINYCKNHSFDQMELCWQNNVSAF